MKRKNLFAVNKMSYVRNKSYRENNCILCKVFDESNEVPNLLIHKGDLLSVTLNLYPYNPGHLMIFTNRHITDIRELSIEEGEEQQKLIKSSLNMLENIYDTNGFNIGYNMGKNSGASIEHLHLHIVPRYPSELGFMEILSGAKLIVEEPLKTAEKLKKSFKNFI